MKKFNIFNFISSLFSSNNKFQFLTFGILSGILIGTTYIPFKPWALLFCYIPLWWYWYARANSYKTVFWSGFWSQFVFNLIGFFWIYHTAHEFGNLPAVVSLLALLLFAALAHLYVPVIGLIFYFLKTDFQFKTIFNFKSNFIFKSNFRKNSQSQRLQKSSWPQSSLLIFTLPPLWALFEIYWPYIFQWNMGYSLYYADFPIYQLADIIGFQGLSFLILLFNSAFLYLFIKEPFQLYSPIKDPSHSKSGFFKKAPLLLLCFLLLNFIGSYHGHQFLKSQEESKINLNILEIQANIGNQERIMAEKGRGFQDYIIQQYIELTRKALADNAENQKLPIDLIIWPESAFPEFLDTPFSNTRRALELKQFVNQINYPLLTGAYSKELYQTEPNIYNALFVIKPNNPIPEVYRKTHLLAFGEYTPFSKWFPFLNDISPAGSGFARGNGPATLKLNGWIVGPQICYEGLYPEFSSKLTQLGAQFLINITNDSWFGRYFEPIQHKEMTLARAVENRRPLIRVTNTGYSTAVLADGRELEDSPLFESWFKVYSIPFNPNSPLTLFTQIGHYLPIGLGIFLLIVLALAHSKKHEARYESQKQSKKH